MPPTFTDVPATHAYYHEIEACYAKGIVYGVTSTTFQPSTVCDIQTLMRWLSRANKWRFPVIPAASDPAMPSFWSDVDQSTAGFGEIQMSAKLGIMGDEDAPDFGPGLLTPTASVKRKWAAIWGSKARDWGGWSPAVARFTDVPKTYYLYKWIERAAKQGFMVGITPTTFEPETTMTRAEVAWMLKYLFYVLYVTKPN